MVAVQAMSVFITSFYKNRRNTTLYQSFVKTNLFLSDRARVTDLEWAFVGCRYVNNDQERYSSCLHGAFSLMGSAGKKRQVLITHRLRIIMINSVKLSAEHFIRVSYPSPDPPAHPSCFQLWLYPPLISQKHS